MAQHRLRRPAGPALAACLLFGLTACTEPPGKGIETVTLPAGTERIDARVARAAQLRTGSIKDDLPEYTGAPGPNGRWPAYPANGRTVYRAVEDMRVGGEGPGARTAAFE